MKTLLITNIPNPYRIPLFNELDQQLQKKQGHLRVLFGTDTYKRRLFKPDLSAIKFDYQILRSKKFKLFSKEGVLITYSGIYHELREYKPNKIIVSGFSIASLKLFILSFFIPFELYIWSGSIHSKGRKESWRQRLFRKILIKKASGGIAYGTHSKNYLIKLGMPSNQISIALNTVDVSFFKEETKKLRKKPLNEAHKLIYIGYLTQGKRIDNILKAFAKCQASKNGCILQIVGDGPYKGKLQELASNMGLDNKVEYTGFKQKQELPKYLADSKIFLFASEYDIWGLVLVESMAAGVPCLASKRAGATIDLIQDGHTGFALDFNDSDMVANHIDLLLDNSVMREQMASNAQSFIESELSLAKSAQGFIERIYS